MSKHSGTPPPRGPQHQKPTPRAKLGAEKLTPEEQRRRFEELAREAGCDEGSDARFEEAVKRIGRVKAHPPKSGS